MRNMFKQLLANPAEPVVIQYTYMKKNGQKIFLEATGRNLLDDSAISGIIINSTDITERKRAEREERLKSKMQALVGKFTRPDHTSQHSGSVLLCQPGGPQISWILIPRIS